MISVCLPVYNFDVTELVEELLRQSIEHKVSIEVLVFDDRSISFYRKRNAMLSSKSNVSYLEFDQNLGRSRIRNHLASFAMGDWLLFMDCDMMPETDHFLKTYAENQSQADVICGGIQYGPKPYKPELMLRWKYGMMRQSRIPSKRQQAPYASFTSGNFMITKEIFNGIRFNEEISGYGHEDTLFALDLQHKGIPILHINNPTQHLGIEPCYEYLIKSEQGVVNLVRLLRIVPNMRKELEANIRLLKLYSRFRAFGMGYPLRWFFRLFNPVIRRMICNNNSSLVLFALYKVGMLAQIYRKPNLSVK